MNGNDPNELVSVTNTDRDTSIRVILACPGFPRLPPEQIAAVLQALERRPPACISYIRLPWSPAYAGINSSGAVLRFLHRSDRGCLQGL